MRPPFKILRKIGPSVVPLTSSHASSAAAATPAIGLSSLGFTFPSWFVLECVRV
jgi:hypothetical protein